MIESRHDRNRRLWGHAHPHRPRRLAQRSAADVIARMDALETEAHDLAPVIVDLHAIAGAVAAEHGHVLGAWYQTEGLVTAARCTCCTATVALRARGHGSNADPTVFLREQGCAAPRERFFVRSVKGPAGHFVLDRENPRGEPVLMTSRLPVARAHAKRLNAPVVDELAKARAKVLRLRGQLAKAEAALAAAA